MLSYYWFDGTLSVAFTPFQWQCLRAGGWIIGAWICTLVLGIPYGAEIAYVLTQVLALIAYFPTVKRLKAAERSPEPITIWISVFIACLCAIYPAVVKHDWKAWLYLVRAIPSAGYVIYLIHGLNVREERQLRNA
ncbi:MAG: hypothetical protein HY226_02520 [Candidatus Vogelbacteria bacterium]|nr:hypothetical protein [Candidatus Vogelbacteria bacterium]